MLEVEPQKDRVAATTEALHQEECQEHMNVMVLHTEAPQECSCAEQKVGGGEISSEDLKRDCRNE
eukprot:3009293-Heterocapsa_arctica.AAC.1